MPAPSLSLSAPFGRVDVSNDHFGSRWQPASSPAGLRAPRLPRQRNGAVSGGGAPRSRPGREAPTELRHGEPRDARSLGVKARIGKAGKRIDLEEHDILRAVSDDEVD